MFLYFFRLQQQPISNSRFLFFIDLELRPSLIFAEIDVGQMRLRLLRIEDKVISINISFLFFIGFYRIFLL